MGVNGVQIRINCYLLAAFQVAVLSQTVIAGGFTEALTSGKAYGDFNLRYETVAQDNNLKDATALTLRSRLGYVTGELAGFSALLEFEDSRPIAGVDDYNDGLGSKPGYSVIADPETTELDQAYLEYKAGGLISRLGRQVITYDNQRFVGHVGWRQDRQTFDAFKATYIPLEDLSLHYTYIDKRNRIFAEERDIDSKDHLINLNYRTSPGQITGYAYLLEEDNAASLSFNTYGVRFNGATRGETMKFLYTAEYATQDKSAAGTPDMNADYLNLKGGLEFNAITAGIAYEVLGSDDGAYGFSTPLATLHKFNGWADQFLGTPAAGLVDLSFSLSGKLAGGNWLITWHDFKADKSSITVDDLGNEIDFSYGRGFAKHYFAGIKYAAYSAGDINVDTDKFWLWTSAGF